MSPDAGEQVAEAFRQEWGRVVAALIGMTGDWDLAASARRTPSRRH